MRERHSCQTLGMNSTPPPGGTYAPDSSRLSLREGFRDQSRTAGRPWSCRFHSGEKSPTESSRKTATLPAPSFLTWLLSESRLSEWKGPALNRPTSSVMGPTQRCDTSRRCENLPRWMKSCGIPPTSYLEERRRGLLSGRPHVLAVDRQDLVALRQPAVGVRRTSSHDVGDEDPGVVPGDEEELTSRSVKLGLRSSRVGIQPKL